MRLLDRVIQRQQSYYEGMASGAAVLMTFGADDKRERSRQDIIAATQQAYATNGIVWAVILARLMLLSEARFCFRSKVDKHTYGTDDLRILEEPWPNGTSGELISHAEQDVSLSGNFYCWKAAPDLLVRLNPQWVTIVSEEDRDPDGRTYRRVIGYDYDPNPVAPGLRDVEAQHFTVDEVAHWSPYPDPLANFAGMSWLTPVLKEASADASLTNYKTLYFDHGQPVTAIKYQGTLKPETIDNLMNRMQAKYGGAPNAWKPIILSSGADPVMGGGLRDLDLRNISAASEVRICAAAGVPPVVVGLVETARPGLYLEAMRRFGDLTCRPLWRSLCACLQKLVPNMPARGVELWYDTTDIAALQAAETEKAQVTQVDAAAVLTFIQAGMTRESTIAAVTSGDLSLLKPDPDAPTPGVAERETITAAESVPVTGPDASLNARPAVKGVPPGGGAVPTKPQTGASKKPMPGSFPAAQTAVPNGKG